MPKSVAPVVAVRPPTWGKMIAQAMQRPDVQAKLHKPRPPKVHPVAWEGLIREPGFLTWLEGFVSTRIRELTHGGSRPALSGGAPPRDRDAGYGLPVDERPVAGNEDDDEEAGIEYAEPVVVRRRATPVNVPEEATDAADAIAEDARDARPVWARKPTGDPFMDRMIANAVVETEKEYTRDPPTHHEKLRKRVRTEARATGNRKIGALFP